MDSIEGKRSFGLSEAHRRSQEEQEEEEEEE